MKNLLLGVSVLIFLSSNAFSHSGRTDSNGGHNCSEASKRKGLCTGYHYHRKKTSYLEWNIKSEDGISKRNRAQS